MGRGRGLNPGDMTRGREQASKCFQQAEQNVTICSRLRSSVSTCPAVLSAHGSHSTKQYHASVKPSIAWLLRAFLGGSMYKKARDGNAVGNEL